MEVKVIINLGECDAPIFKELLAVIAKGQITQKSESTELDDKKWMHAEIVDEEKSSKKTSKSKTKKTDAVVSTDTVEGKDSITMEEVKAEEPVKDETSDEVKHASLENIRAIARSLADANRQKEYKPILEKYGYAKVNLIEEKDYDAIYAEMSKLVGDDNA
ncbi:MAG: hypothetical protein ACI35S_05395 [Anaeroplasma sp.]